MRRRVVAASSYRRLLSEPPDDPIAPLIRELDEASRRLSEMHPLTPPQAEHIAARIDRLTSQLANRVGLFDEIDRAD